MLARAEHEKKNHLLLIISEFLLFFYDFFLLKNNKCYLIITSALLCCDTNEAKGSKVAQKLECGCFKEQVHVRLCIFDLLQVPACTF